MKKLILILSILLITTLSFAEPDWFSSGKLSKYPQEWYLIGMGEGNTREAAQANAQRAVASQLKVTIESEVNLYTQELSGDARASYTESFESSTQTTVDETIKGVQFVEQSQEGDNYFVAAVLDLEKYESSLRSELEQEWNKIGKLISAGHDFILENKIFVGLDNFLEAQKFLPTFYTKKAVYDFISSNTFQVSENISIASLNSDIKDILSEIKLSVVSGDDQEAKAGETLPKPIVFSVKFSGSKLPSFPIKITYGNNKLIANENTDEQGESKCWITALSLRNDRGSVIAKPNLYKLPNFFRKYLKNSEAKANYSVAENAAMTFSIIIEDEDGNRLKRVEKKIAREVGRLGHNVSDKANFGLQGTVTLVNVDEVDGYKGTKFMVESEMLLNLIVNDSEKKLGSIMVSGKGMNARSEDAALRASYNKLRINKRKFAKMFADASDVLQDYLPAKETPTKLVHQEEAESPPVEVILSKVVEHDVFTFELKSCKMDNRTITCSLLITNNSEDDSNLRIYRRHTKIFDEAGNEYIANFLKLANSETRGRLLDKLIIPQVPTSAEIVFEKVSSSVKEISLLNVRFQSNHYDYNAQFRQIDIEGK